MDEILPLEEAPEMKDAIAGMIEEMKELRRQGQQDQAKVEKARVETRAMLDTIAKLLAELKAA